MDAKEKIKKGGIGRFLAQKLVTANKIEKLIQ
jgi:hypothetical protein